MLKSQINILDGGLASTLENEGSKCDGDPLWSAKVLFNNPSMIYKVHCMFLQSGANILTTASYQASQEGFKNHLGISEHESSDLVKKSVKLAQDARNNYGKEGILIAGSVGPYGAYLADGSEYTGKYAQNMKEEDFITWHEPRIKALVEAGADLIAIETMPSLKEAKAIMKLMSKFRPCKAWVSFSCRDENHTNFGDKFSSCVQECCYLFSQQLAAIGVNCSHPSIINGLMASASKEVPNNDIPYIIYPNSGELWDTNKGWLPTGREVSSFASQVPSWVAGGAKVIGGCCRVNPDEIAKIYNIVKAL